MSPVLRSHEKRQGLRRPYAQISGSPPPLANGLSDGIVYPAPAEGVGSMRRILPSRVSSDCAFPPSAWPAPMSPGGAAVPEPEVQLAVRSEARLPAVVVRGRRVVDREH